MMIRPVTFASTTNGPTGPKGASKPELSAKKPEDSTLTVWKNKGRMKLAPYMPGPDTKKDLKKVGIGMGVIAGGVFAASCIPFAPLAVAVQTIGIWGGAMYGAGSLVSLIKRKFN